jgi:hypothetical protein
MKKNKYSVIVNVNLEFIVEAKNADEAEDLMQEVELPKEYLEDSFEIVKTGKIGKNGYADYGD